MFPMIYGLKLDPRPHLAFRVALDGERQGMDLQ